MKNYLFLILLLLISCKKHEVKKEIIPNDETLDLRYEVLNQLINDQIKEDSINGNIYNIEFNGISFGKLEENEEPPSLYFAYDSVFIAQDSIYYKNQDIELKDFKLNKNRITEKLEFITTDEILNLHEKYQRNFWKEFHKRYREKCIQTFSVPFFNKDKTACIVQNSMACGPLHGGGYVAIYKKVNGKWIITKTLKQWVS